jgi:hypothetical protein
VLIDTNTLSRGKVPRDAKMLLGIEAGATMAAMPKEDDINVSSNGSSSNGAITAEDIDELIAGLTGPAGDVVRELAAEGYAPDPQRFTELMARMATWPE